MEIKTNNKKMQKAIILIITIFMVFNLIFPTIAMAEEEDEFDAGEPVTNAIKNFFLWLGDCVMGLEQKIFFADEGVIEKDWVEIDEGSYYFRIPKYRVSPESIFSNKIPTLDINFFNPSDQVIIYAGYDHDESRVEFVQLEGKMTEDLDENGAPIQLNLVKSQVEEFIVNWIYEREPIDKEEILKKLEGDINIPTEQVDIPRYEREMQDKYGMDLVDTPMMMRSNVYYTFKDGQKYQIHIEPRGDGPYQKLYANITISKPVYIEAQESSASVLQPTVSYWYNLLRNVAIIGLLSVLVYVGIRIVLSSSAADKSKYKEMLKDWIVALCLLFFMHYFMSFTITIAETITGALVTGEEYTNEDGVITNDTIKKHVHEETGIEYTGDKLLGDVRLRTQYGTAKQQIAFIIIYFVLIIYTIMFSIMYLKRVIYMAFFTMMAPLVALTYPLDKMRDGKAQAFDMWLKEYSFNLLIQPFHLIVYYVLVGSSIELAIDNPLYAIVAIGFLMEAEKLLRKFFGLDKAESSGVLKGALGGAMLMQGINAVRRGVSALGRGGKHQGKGGEGREKDDRPIRTADRDVDDLINDIGSGRGISDALADNQNQGQTTTGARNRLNGSGQEEEGTDTQEGGNTPNKKEKTHGIRTAATMGIKWALKGGLGATKLAARATAAGALGTIGIAAGLASEDYRNVFSYGLAGLGAGNALAGAGINTVKKLPSAAYRVRKTASDIRDEFEREAYGPTKRKEKQNERADDQFLNDKEIQRLYKDKLGKDKYEKAMRAALKYREYGVTDNNAIIKAMKLKGLGRDDDSRRILIANSASQIGRKDIDAYRDRLLSRGLDRSKVDSIIEGIRKYNNFE